MKKTIACLIITILITGCYSTGLKLHTKLANQKMKQGKTTNYSIGYADGYMNGEKAGGGIGVGDFPKNDEMYKADEDYKIGWDDGFIQGKGEMESWLSTIKQGG